MTRTTEQTNQSARAHALAQIKPPFTETTRNVAYSTQGHLLIVGPEDKIRAAACQLPALPSVTLLVTERLAAGDLEQLTQIMEQSAHLSPYEAKLIAAEGYLGQFNVQVQIKDDTVALAKVAQGRNHFDLILDLGSTPIFSADLKPAGYFYIDPEQDQLADVITTLPDMVGEFEKPRYIHINNDICAHASRGKVGCTRCLDVCPANAIQSIKQLINIDPYLCHGAGGCTTACPTGAIHYEVPQPARLMDYLIQLSKLYLEQGGKQPVLVLHDRETGQALWEQASSDLPGNFLPVALEEVASAGMEIWLAALTMGYTQVIILAPETIPESMRTLLAQQVRLAHIILQGLNQPTEHLALVPALDKTLLTGFNALLAGTALPHAALTPKTDKRATLFAAVDAFAKSTEETLPESIALPASAPFGQVQLNESACTLCMSCTAVCPVSALKAVGDKPGITFTEQDCVQCGLCTSSCPENALTLQPRLLLTDTRAQPQTLLVEEPYNCISCGKGFAPQRTVEKMLSKLSEHRFFQGDAINRLKMCEDCRVKDIYADLNAHPEKQLEL